VLEGMDVTAVGGGLSILTTMLFIIRLAFSRLDKQDAAWMELLSAAERRAVAAETTLAELRKSVAVDREEIKRLGAELADAKLQIAMLKKPDGAP
jgi:hypothetical protein